MRAGARRARTVNETSASQGSESQRNQTFVSDSSRLGAGEIPPIVLQPPFQPRSDDRYQVDDLLKYHDRAFVQHAYRAILKRGPDATGFNNFIDALRNGRLNKIDVLARLRYSAEGRAKRVHIEGLFFPASGVLYGLPVSVRLNVPGRWRVCQSRSQRSTVSGARLSTRAECEHTITSAKRSLHASSSGLSLARFRVVCLQRQQIARWRTTRRSTRIVAASTPLGRMLRRLSSE